MTLRLGLVGGGWISRLHLDALHRLGRTELIGVVAGSRATADEVTVAVGRHELRRPRPDARGGSPGRRLRRGAAASSGGRRGAARRPADPVPDREAALRHRRRRAGAPGRRRSSRTGSSSPSAITCGRSTSWPKSGHGWPSDRPSCSSPAGWTPRRARPGGAGPPRAAARSSSRRRTCTTWRGRWSARRPWSAPRRRATSGRRRRAWTWPTAAPPSCASRPALSGRSRTRARSRRPSSRSRSSRTACSRGCPSTPDRGQGDWHATFDDGTVIRAISAECDPYEKQAAAFLDAVEWADPGGVLSSYEDALRTDRLTRAVVAATGAPG